MASSIHRFRYFVSKARDSLATSLKSYEIGQMTTKELVSRLWSDVFKERMTILRSMKVDKMEPTFSGQQETLLIRKVPFPSRRSIFVGDVVIFKDPSDSKMERIRRVAAVDGEEMVSINENDKPFELEKGACWVLCDNDLVKPKDAADSRTFGPLNMGSILGRVMYAMQSISEHGRIMNSEEAMQEDSPILAVELDLDELSEYDKI